MDDPSTLGAAEPEAPPDTPPSPELLRLRECIERAPLRHRLVAELWLSQATADEVADVLKIGKRSVYVIKARKLHWLQECVEGAK